ncbi:MAG: hypothetical protein Q7T16_06330 [Candidatus Burarchaeum sp.]|nr:hypothetical protein [Candidatus Burarchaeum sp.]MDO8340245.1 hypothetical protein [Candidatus Burarchaeum sp.]
MKIGTLGFVIFVGMLLLLSAIVYADFASTRVFFILRHAISFTVTLPGQLTNATSSTNLSLPQGNAVFTSEIEFNTSNVSYAWINASVGPTNVQTDAVPIFNYTNTGTVPLNISLSFNGTTMPPGVNVTASNGTNGGTLGGLLATGGLGCGLAGGIVGLTKAPDHEAVAGEANYRCKNITNTASPFIADLQPQQSRSLWVWAFFDNFPAAAGTVGTGAVTRNLTHISQPTT